MIDRCRSDAQDFSVVATAVKFLSTSPGRATQHQQRLLQTIVRQLLAYHAAAAGAPVAPVAAATARTAPAVFSPAFPSAIMPAAQPAADPAISLDRSVS